MCPNLFMVRPSQGHVLLIRLSYLMIRTCIGKQMDTRVRDSDVAKSPPHKLTVKLKRPSIPDVFSAPSADSTAHQQPTADTEHTQEPLTEEVCFCSVDTYTHPQFPRMIVPMDRRSSSFNSRSLLRGLVTRSSPSRNGSARTVRYAFTSFTPAS